MSSKINEDKIKEQFEKAKRKAEQVIDDPDQVKKVASSAWEKAKELKGPLAQVWEQLKLMIQMVKAWAKGQYNDVPTTSLIAILGGLMYLLSPIDLIPDFIPVLGYLDDIFILGVVFTQVAKDLEAFAKWQEEFNSAQPETEAQAEEPKAGETEVDQAEAVQPEPETTEASESTAKTAKKSQTKAKKDEETQA